jgi:hypothetical protein
VSRAPATISGAVLVVFVYTLLVVVVTVNHVDLTRMALMVVAFSSVLGSGRSGHRCVVTGKW